MKPRFRQPSTAWAAASALALAALLRAAAARAEPQAVLAAPTLSGAQTAAAYAAGSGLEQIAVVADAAANQLRFFSVVSLAEVGTPFDLLAGCGPSDVLAVGAALYVACRGIDAVDVLDLTGFSLDAPALTRLATRPGGVAAGDGPARLLQIQNGPDSVLAVMDQIGRTVSVVALSGGNAPVGIDADDSSEAADPLTAPVPVRVCGDDPSAANRGTPVGLGIGTERFYVACDDGVLSYFNPFAGGDFSASTTLSGLVPSALTDAAGISGTRRFFLQTQNGEFIAADLTAAESGGSVVLQALYDDGTARFLVQGPATPRGILPFFDSQDGRLWLALLGGVAAAEVQLFDVDDLDDAPYSPPAARTADRTIGAGLAAFSTSAAVRAFFHEGNLYVPTEGASFSIATAGPVFTFTSPAAPLAVSSLADPGLSTCTSNFPLAVPWTTNEAVDGGSFTALLVKSTDPAHPLAFVAVAGTSGDVTIEATDVADLSAASETALIRVAADDADGNTGVAEEPVLVDQARPSPPTDVAGRIVQGTLYLSWSAATDAGGLLASGVSGYFVRVVRDAGTPEESATTTAAATTSFEQVLADVQPGETVEVSVASCDGAGNRSASFTSPVVVAQGVSGGAGAFGETGGCVLSARPAPDGNLAPLLLCAAALFLSIRIRRRRSRR